MDKDQIKALLKSAHLQLIDHANGLSNEDYEYSKNGAKWNAGQEVLHIIKSVKALNRAMSMPKVALKLTFGKANRPTRSYDEVVAKYQAKLSEGNIVTTSPFEPDNIVFNQRDELNTKLMSKVDQLISLLDRYSEADLDYYVVPHPLLGKMTLREISYFTAYHVGHHLDNSKRNLAERSSG